MYSEKDIKDVLKRYNQSTKDNIKRYSDYYQTRLAESNNEEAAWKLTMSKIREDNSKVRKGIKSYLYPCDPSIVSILYSCLMLVLFMISLLIFEYGVSNVADLGGCYLTTAIIEFIVTLVIFIVYLCVSKSKTALNTIVQIPFIILSLFKIFASCFSVFLTALSSGGMQPDSEAAIKQAENFENYLKSPAAVRNPFVQYLILDGESTTSTVPLYLFEIILAVVILLIALIYFLAKTKQIRNDESFGAGYYIHRKCDYRNKYIEYGIYERKDFEKIYKKAIIHKYDLIDGGISEKEAEMMTWDRFMSHVKRVSKGTKQQNKYLEPFIVSVVLMCVNYIEQFCFFGNHNINTYLTTLMVTQGIVLIAYIVYLCISKRKSCLTHVIFLTSILGLFVFLIEYYPLTGYAPFAANKVDIFVLEKVIFTHIGTSGDLNLNGITGISTYNFSNLLNTILFVYTLMKFRSNNQKSFE